MRRKRRRLQVDTFPFLAVLLCAMGSLILLLLVLDRRAKMVAQAKAKAALEEFQSEQKKKRDDIIAARRAEWEKRKKALHEQLLCQHKKVMAELQRARMQQAQAKKRLTQRQDLLARWRAAVNYETTTVEHLQQQLDEQQKLLSQAKTASTAAYRQIMQWAKELEHLENTMGDLKSLRKQGRRTYSVVPYHGKNGDPRKPIYAECNSQGVVFHPDGKKLVGFDFSADAMRLELQNRMEKAASTGTGKAPSFYLMLLVRPNGVDNYYTVQAALAGMSIDFGYELIDQDWVLDFSGKGKLLPSSLPVVAAPSVPSGRPGVVPKGFRSGGYRTGGGVADGKGQFPLLYKGTNGPYLPKWKPSGERLTPHGKVVLGMPRGADGEYIAGGGSGGKGGLSPSQGFGPWKTASKNSKSVFYGPFGPDGGRKKGTLSPNPSPKGEGEKKGFAAGGIGEKKGFTPGGRGEKKGFAPGGKGEKKDFAPGGGWEKSTRAPNLSPRGRGEKERPSGGGRKGGVLGNAKAPYASVKMVNVNGKTAKDQRLSPANAPQEGNGRVASVDSAKERKKRKRIKDPNVADHPEPHTGQPGEDPGEGGIPGLPAILAHKKSRYRPPTLRFLTGNRDWYIPVVCKAGEISLPLSRRRFSVNSLVSSAPGDNPLTQTMRQTIMRRQIQRQPGQPPYRPILRFEVWPDGLRTYHLVYPMLEELHLPMVRRNVPLHEPDLSDFYRK